MKREIWKLNLKTCKKNLWMQSDQYSQRALNNLCNCVTEPIGWRQYFCPSPSKWVSFWSKCNLTLPPRNIAPWHSPKFQICRLGSHRNFACVKRPLFKSFQKWPNMANFTTENNTYCFRIGPAFLDTEWVLFWADIPVVTPSGQPQQTSRLGLFQSGNVYKKFIANESIKLFEQTSTVYSGSLFHF